ncbi:unnamed protein product [Darwinula stevensoni]|uniref:Vacuolar-sorting protein SNF8 n=1 Tax=Darwinula stevensoni TaxID=69355 RepID=A0A7R8XBP8_9CRUS|nr:unnamed protein product [Darwinula stevensoni]CAG0893002.1 unnamed protein product [Darwinula stevensoni]
MNHFSHLLEAFREKLQSYASRYKNEIRKDPQFRRQFQEMCSSIGVDPLASSKVCMATSHRNGGLISLEELRERVLVSRGGKKQYHDDLMRAIKKLRVLGTGFTLIPSGNRYLVQSVPMELSMDHTQVLNVAEGSTLGCVTREDLEKGLGWTRERAERALRDMVREGMAWVDEHDLRLPSYWFPALFPQAMHSN